MPAMTRGPLPSRVYWVRRLMVLGTAILLVVAIARLLGNGSDASGEQGAELTARTGSSTAGANGDPLPTTSGTSSTAGPSGTATGRRPDKGRRTSQAPTLAAPTGTCAGSDVVATPKVADAVAGRDVKILLQLRTIESEACTWRVGPESIAVDITSGKDAIWSSRDCPRAIAAQDVILRSAVTTEVPIVWKEAKRSDSDGCTARTGWALQGWYHVTAAALGGGPSDLQFELTLPVAATITRTAKPTQTPSANDKPQHKPQHKPQNKPSRTPSGSPSGAVEPD